MSNREEFISKWERNLDLITKFKSTWESYLNRTNTWNKKAFFDSEATNEQCFIALKQVSELEYSEVQHQAIKTMFIHDNAIKDYINNLDIQYVNLKKMYDEVIKNINLLNS